jgi:tRNA-binding protein
MAETPLSNTIRVGRVREAEAFEEARTPGLVKLVIELGDEQVNSAAQLGPNYELSELIGRQVLCVTDLGTVDIAGFESQVLTVGVPGPDGDPVLVTPDQDVPLGGTLY